MSPRLVASYIIKQIIEERMTLTFVLLNNTLFENAGKDKALIQEICFGVLRWYIQLTFLLESLLNKKIRKKDNILNYLLLTGLYQLMHMRIPAYTVISETVEICTTLNKDWAKGLVNAVLRRYQREAQIFQEKLKSDTMLNYAHPAWLLKKIQQDWPNHWQKILDSNNQRPPMYLRINKQKINRDEYLKLLSKKNIQCSASLYSSQGILLEKPLDVTELPGFKAGLVSVQDLAAQFAVKLLELHPGQTVLDACAAPGGKSAHILETEPKIKALTVVEKYPARAKKLQSTLSRLQLKPIMIIDDIRNIGTWWNKQPFDRILLDAPCSATGIIRRHPDIKLLRTEDEISQVTLLQYELLDTLWQLLKPGGILVYVTCSILKQENTEIIKRFITHQHNCHVKKVDINCGINMKYGKQFLSGEYNMDGFFYSCIEKQ